MSCQQANKPSKTTFQVSKSLLYWFCELLLKVQMTILSNHRLHSYKSTAANHNRVVTPKKIPMKLYEHVMRFRLYYAKKVATLQVASATTQKDNMTKVDEQGPLQLLYGMNIYEDFYGWFPEVYEATYEEMYGGQPEYEPDIEEEYNEELWAHLDYLEWMTD